MTSNDEQSMLSGLHASSQDARAQHERWLGEITQLPTAAGHEGRVADWIKEWATERDDIVLQIDPVGNLALSFNGAPEPSDGDFVLTAHMDHPAFVVEKVDGRYLEMSFRGGVLDPYFEDAEVVVFAGGDTPVRGTVTKTEQPPKDSQGPAWVRRAWVTLEEDAEHLAVGDLGRWSFPEAEVIKRNGLREFHTDACDDLALVTAALCTLDELRQDKRAHRLRVVFTRAEEVGFVGAIGACEHSTIHPGARVCVLEASRAFSESPIGGGPIVRVGDRISVFSPSLTGAISHVAEAVSKNENAAGDLDGNERQAKFNWQRKLMAGGMCEASCFTVWGYESSCICLPLGNYHNMAELDRVTGPDEEPDAAKFATVGREHIALNDFHNLVTLLRGCALGLGEAPSSREKLESLYDKRSWVVGQGVKPEVF